MVNRRGERPLDVELARQPCRGVAVLDAQLAPGAVAVGVDRRLGHAQFAGDLLRREVLIDQPQAFALTQGEQAHEVVPTVVSRVHAGPVNDDFSPTSTLARRVNAVRLQ